MNWTAIFNFLLIAGALQGFLFCLATFIARKRIEKAVVLLNLFVLVLSLNNLQAWLLEKDWFAFSFFLKHLMIPWYVLILPFYHAFLITYLDLSGKRRTYLRLAFLIFGLELAVRLGLLFWIELGGGPSTLMETYNIMEDALTLIFSLFVFREVVGLAYLKPAEDSSDAYLISRKRWIRRSVQLGGAVIFLWFIAILLNAFSSDIRAPYSYYPLRLGTSVLIYWMGYQAFFQYVLLQDRLSLRKQLQSRKPGPGALELSDTAEEDRSREAFDELDRYLREHQSYLDPLLSQESLAQELGMGTRTLSRLVNRYAGAHFADYINTYRVEYAKLLLRDPAFEPYPVTAIGLESGFNSRSTFYTAFKRMTGETPAHFRK